MGTRVDEPTLVAMARSGPSTWMSLLTGEVAGVSSYTWNNITGTNAKLPLKSNSLKKRGKKGSLSSAADRRAGVKVIPGARVDGGPNKDHLKKYGLTERSHPMDWLNSILPMTGRRRWDCRRWA